jgi:hypothetical protein
MIQNDEQLKGTQEALAIVEQALAAIRSRRSSMHPSQFAVMAEGPIEDIWRLRRQIDEYLGLTFTPAEPFPDEKAEVK